MPRLTHLFALMAGAAAIPASSLLRDEHSTLSVSLLEPASEKEEEHQEHAVEAAAMRAIVAPNYAPKDLACPADSVILMKTPQLHDTPAKCANECNRHEGCVGFTYECASRMIEKHHRRTGFGHCELIGEIANRTNCEKPENNDEVSGFPIKSLYEKINAPAPAGFLYYPRLACYPESSDASKMEAKMTLELEANTTAKGCADKCEAAGCALFIHSAEDPEASAGCALLDTGAVSCKYFRMEEVEEVAGDKNHIKELSFGTYVSTKHVPGGIATHASGNFAEMHQPEDEPVPEDAGKAGLMIALVAVSVFGVAVSSVFAYTKYGPQAKNQPMGEQEETEEPAAAGQVAVDE